MDRARSPVKIETEKEKKERYFNGLKKQEKSEKELIIRMAKSYCN